MKQFQRIFKYFALFHCCVALHAQKTNQVFTSPSQSFASFKLMTYKGLPLLNGYEGLYEKDSNGRRTQKITGTFKYFSLLEMKYLGEYYQGLESYIPKPLKTRRVYSYANWDKTVAQYFGEQHLRKTVDRFWVPSAEFRYKKNYGSPNGRPWAGDTEIEQVQAFQKYLKSNDFKKLQNWAKSIWPEDQVTGYSVNKFKIGQYDMLAKGYWLKMESSGANGGSINLHGQLLNLSLTHKPTHDYERDFATVMGTGRNEILLEVSQSEAEKFEERLNKTVNYRRPKREVFVVQQIQLKRGRNDFVDKSFGPKREILFSYSNPNLDLYWDNGLTDKIATIDLDQVIYKN
nr:hypothetical protein [Allomuricauda sp.]